MRISDWSSDVCSSDLGGTGRRAGFRFQYRKMWGFESLRQHQTAANADGRAPQDYDFRKVALSMQTAETLNEALQSAYKLVIPAKDIRSEEHTSELLSLMRIPSAVFRLQKQTIPTLLGYQIYHLDADPSIAD